MNIKQQIEMQARYNTGNFENSERITPESINKMKKADVQDLLEMHGDKVKGTLPEMRQRLKSIMFVGEV